MAYGVIYKITNMLNGMPYIGQTTRPIEERFREHARRNKFFIGNAIHKYGKENFSIEIIKECATLEQRNERERYWIAYFNCISPNGYNLTIVRTLYQLVENTTRRADTTSDI